MFILIFVTCKVKNEQHKVYEYTRIDSTASVRISRPITNHNLILNYTNPNHRPSPTTTGAMWCETLVVPIREL